MDFIEVLLILLIIVTMILAVYEWTNHCFRKIKDMTKKQGKIFAENIKNVETKLESTNSGLSSLGAQVGNVVSTTTLSWSFQTTSPSSNSMSGMLKNKCKKKEEKNKFQGKEEETNKEENAEEEEETNKEENTEEEGAFFLTSSVSPSPTDGSMFYQGLWMDPSGEDGPWTPILNLNLGSVTNPEFRFAMTETSDGISLITFSSTGTHSFSFHVTATLLAPPSFFLPVPQIEFGLLINPILNNFYVTDGIPAETVSTFTRVAFSVLKTQSDVTTVWSVTLSPGDSFTIVARTIKNVNVISGMNHPALPPPVYLTDSLNCVFFQLPFFQILLDDIH